MAVQYFAVLKFNRLKKRAAQSLNIGTLNLIAQSVRIHNRSALESRDNPEHLHLSGLSVGAHLDEGCNIAKFFVSAAHPESMSGRFWLPPPKLFCCRFKCGPQAIVFQVL